MAKISIRSKADAGATVVSNIFIDKYMTSANGEYVKVYLYLLRCLGSVGADCSFSAMADHLEHTEKDLLRAFRYWQRQGLLELEEDENKKIVGIRLVELSSLYNESSAAAVAEPVAPAETPVVPKAKKEAKKPEYTPDQIKEFRKDEDVQELLFIAEAYLKKPVTTTEINTILYWYDELSMPTDLIAYLVEYSISKGHNSFRYMNKIALNWKDNGITTLEMAKAQTAAHSKIFFTVMKALGITGRNLVAAEQSFISKWTKDYGFGDDIISEACSRTIQATHQPSFEYTDSILSSWHNSNVHTLKDVAVLDEQFAMTKKVSVKTTEEQLPKRTKFSNFNQRTKDYDELEKILLSTSVH